MPTKDVIQKTIRSETGTVDEIPELNQQLNQPIISQSDNGL